MKERYKILSRTCPRSVGMAPIFMVFRKQTLYMLLSESMIVGMEKEYIYPIPPRYLYKYRSLSGDLKFVEALVVNRELYFANRKQLNDPYELKFKTVRKKTKTEYKNIIENHLKQLGFDVHNQRLGGVEGVALLEKYEPATFLENQFPELMESIDNIGIFSLTEDSVNIPMWSYYADSHKGICIEFDLNEISEHSPRYIQGGVLAKVDYSVSSEFPELDMFPHTDQIRNIMSVKDKKWIHEKEWRLLWYEMDGNMPIGRFGIKHLDQKKVISAIIFGLKTPSENKEGIFQWVKTVEERDGHVIALKQAIPVPDKFEIDIVDFQ